MLDGFAHALRLDDRSRVEDDESVGPVDVAFIGAGRSEKNRRSIPARLAILVERSVRSIRGTGCERPESVLQPSRYL